MTHSDMLILFAMALILFSMACAVPYYVYYRKATNYLKEIYPQRWEELGRPALSLQASPAGTARFVNYLLLYRHSEIEDKQLAKYLRLSSWFLYGSIGPFFVALISIFVFMATQ